MSLRLLGKSGRSFAEGTWLAVEMPAAFCREQFLFCVGDMRGITFDIGVTCLSGLVQRRQRLELFTRRPSGKFCF